MVLLEFLAFSNRARTGKIQLVDLAPRIQQLRQHREQLQLVKSELELEFGSGSGLKSGSDLLSKGSYPELEWSELTGTIQGVDDVKTVSDYVSDLRNLLEKGSLAESKSFIRSFVKEVRVTGDDVLLTYTMPMPPKGLPEETLPVLSIGHYGGQ